MNTKSTYTFIVALLVSIFASSQNLNRMKEEKRNKKLIEIATKAVKTYMPGYYREYSKPIIEKFVADKTDYEKPEFGVRKGRILYRVTFLYDKNKEYFRHEFAAEVDIWGDNGEIYGIMSGNHYGGRLFKEHEAKTINEVLYPYFKAEEPKSNLIIEVISDEEYERRAKLREKPKQK